jgi:hypothetical protein
MAIGSSHVTFRIPQPPDVLGEQLENRCQTQTQLVLVLRQHHILGEGKIKIDLLSASQHELLSQFPVPESSKSR